LAATITYSGTYEVKKEVQKNVHQLDFTFTTVTGVPNNTTARDAMNTISLCGKNGWVLDQPIDLSGSSSNATCPVNTIPEHVYDIYSTEDNHLILGEGDDKSDPTKRPTILDRKNLFQKIK
jgi:hypothetical protein